MLKWLGGIVVVIVIVVASLFAAYSYNLYTWKNPPTILWIKNGLLFDGTSTTAKPNPGILIREGTISCIGPQCSIPDEATTIDATSQAIVPGLIELHGHFFGVRASAKPPTGIASLWNNLRLQPDVRRKLITSGITSFRSVGDPESVIIGLKQQITNQEIAGPRMFIAGPLFTAPGGHPANRGQGWIVEQMTVQSDDPSFVKAKVAALAKQGVDGIKVVYQGRTNEQGEVILPRISESTLQAIVEEADKHQLWIAAHIGSAEEANTAIKAGITTIEHGIRHGNLIDESTLSLIQQHNTIYVPTLGREPKGHLNIPALVQAGVTLGVGTDTQGDMIIGDSYHQELTRMVDAGVPDVLALLAATRNGAKALGLADKLGAIEKGKFADLIIVNGSPWENISDLKQIDTVIAGGRIAYRKN